MPGSSAPQPCRLAVSSTGPVLAAKLCDRWRNGLLNAGPPMLFHACQSPVRVQFLRRFCAVGPIWGEVAHPIQDELYEHGDDGHIEDAVLDGARIVHIAQRCLGRNRGGPMRLGIPTAPSPVPPDALRSMLNLVQTAMHALPYHAVP